MKSHPIQIERIIDYLIDSPQSEEPKKDHIVSKSYSMDPAKTEAVDAPLSLIGFEIEDLSPKRVTGHLLVTQKCCQVQYIFVSSQFHCLNESVATE